MVPIKASVRLFTWSNVAKLDGGAAKRPMKLSISHNFYIVRGGNMKSDLIPMYCGPPPALYPALHLLLAKTALQGCLLCRAGSLIQSSGPTWTSSNWVKCLEKSSKDILKIVNVRTRQCIERRKKHERLTYESRRLSHGTDICLSCSI